jgi:hypothetical protein
MAYVQGFASRQGLPKPSCLGMKENWLDHPVLTVRVQGEGQIQT